MTSTVERSQDSWIFIMVLFTLAALFILYSIPDYLLPSFVFKLLDRRLSATLLGTWMLILLMLATREEGWKVRDWYTFSIWTITISLISVISLWMWEPSSNGRPIAENVLIGFSAIATVLMVFYVALQTKATKEAVLQSKGQFELVLRREHTAKIREQVIKPLLDEFSRMHVGITNLYTQRGFDASDSITYPWKPNPYEVDFLLFNDLIENHASNLRKAIEGFNQLLKKLENTNDPNKRGEILKSLERQRDVIRTELKRLELMEILPGRCEFIGELEEKK